MQCFSPILHKKKESEMQISETALQISLLSDTRQRNENVFMEMKKRFSIETFFLPIFFFHEHGPIKSEWCFSSFKNIRIMAWFSSSKRKQKFFYTIMNLALRQLEQVLEILFTIKFNGRKREWQGWRCRWLLCFLYSPT